MPRVLVRLAADSNCGKQLGLFVLLMRQQQQQR
jgi:hypothetical protein